MALHPRCLQMPTLGNQPPKEALFQYAGQTLSQLSGGYLVSKMSTALPRSGHQEPFDRSYCQATKD
jgi:hypothetical protein